MDNKQTHAILFNNKIYQKRTSIRVLCLNPTCFANRLCMVEQSNPSSTVQHQDHLNCKGWIYSLDTLRSRFNHQLENPLNQILNLDYLQKPIQSIFYSENFASIRWEDHLYSFFQQLQKLIEEELTKTYIKCQKSIRSHLDENSSISTKIAAFCEEIALNWDQSHEEIYRKYLQPDLIEIQKKGRIYISNPELLNVKQDEIMKEIRNIQYCIWKKELDYDQAERMTDKRLREQIKRYDMMSVQQITNKIQEIERMFREKIKFFQGKDTIEGYCFKCPAVVTSKKAQNIKLRKQQCRKMIVNHFYTAHIDEVVSRTIKTTPIRLCLEELKYEVLLKNIKNVMVIDRENMTFNTNNILNTPDIFCVEVLSKNNANIAKYKYLIAQSAGKDAADIMIIIVLYELSKLKLQSITLLTNDHYGQTLQPIFAHLGVNINIMNKQERSVSICEEY